MSSPKPSIEETLTSEELKMLQSALADLQASKEQAVVNFLSRQISLNHQLGPKDVVNADNGLITRVPSEAE